MKNTISTQAKKLIDITKGYPSKTKTKILTIVSGKGGVGKSTFVANISYLMSKKNLKVCMLDADIGLANMQVLFNIKPEVTFFDYIDAKARLENIFIGTGHYNLTLVAGRSGYEYINNTSSFIFSRMIEDILALNRFDLLVIDTGAGLNEYVREFISISPNILAIATTDPSALTDMYALIKMLSQDKTKDKLLMCFNHTKNYQIGQDITKKMQNLIKSNKFEKEFLIKYVGSVSTSSNIITVGAQQKLFVKEFIKELATKELEQIVDLLMQEI